MSGWRPNRCQKKQVHCQPRPAGALLSHRPSPEEKRNLGYWQAEAAHQYFTPHTFLNLVTRPVDSFFLLMINYPQYWIFEQECWIK
jgi:hypothetical protein